MENEDLLQDLFRLFVREDLPPLIKAAIATHFGEAHYMLAKEAVIAALSDTDSIVRDASVDAVANHWHLQEAGPKLLEMLKTDPQDFVRMRAAQGLGAIRYVPALASLKRIVLDSEDALQQTAYESILSILGKDNYDPLELGLDTPVEIDWQLLHKL